MKRISIVLLLLTLFVTAQAQFIIDAEYRPRFEFRDGYSTLKTENSDPAYFITQRTRLNLNHTHNKLTTRISIQDYRVWGDQKFKLDEPSMNLYEAWFKIQLNEYFSLTSGRQSFDIDNKRLFSSANWNQVSLSHDGVSIDYTMKTFNFKMLTAFNQAGVSNFGTDYSAQINNYKFLNVIWLEKKLKDITLANLTITDGYQKEGTTSTDYYRFTSGLIFKIKKEANDFQFRGFYQTGKNKTGQEISAFYTSIQYANKLSSTLTLTGGFELLSGTDYTDSANQKDNAFDILYGTRHAYNGIMDYFSIPSTTKNAGLFDGYFKADFSKIRNWKLAVQYHYFALANNYVFNDELQDKFLGHEIDLIANYKISEDIALQLGYSMFLGASTTLEHIKGVEGDGIPQFFYTMITVKPTFFKN